MKSATMAIRASLLMILLLWAGPTKAISPFPFREKFENDLDMYQPTDNNPLGDPLLGGLPPGAGAAHPGGFPDHISGQDWFEFRADGSGIIEEVPGGHRNNAGTAISAGDGSGHFGLIQPSASDAPFGRVARQVTPPPFRFSAQTDLYIDPSLTPNSNNNIDFWWTNAVNRRDSDVYYTEAGIGAEVSTTTPGTWDIKTTDNNFIANVPVGSWVTLEVEPVRSATGGIDFVSRVWNIGHTQLLGSLTKPEYTQVAQFDLMGGPRYNWYSFFEPNVPYLFVDNVGWAAGITRLPLIRGDANGDGKVDSLDLGILLNHFNKFGSYSEGDFNGTSTVDSIDLGLLLQNYNKSTNGGALNSLAVVPEPATTELAAGGLLGLAALGWRKRRVSMIA